MPKRRVNPLTAKRIDNVDWKDTGLLRTFISDRGKIRARRVTGLTPRQPGLGKSVSHSTRRTSRRWDPNIQTRRYWIKTVDRLGVEAAVARLRVREERI